LEKKVAEIHQILSKLVGHHRQLLDAVRAEREALVNADLKCLQEVVFTKQALIENIRHEESLRLKATAELAMEWKVPFKDLTVSNIVIRVQGKDLKSADQIRSTHTTLALLIQRVTEQNNYNKGLVERSLEHVHEMKRNAFGESAPKAETYTQQGQRATQSPAARLISKEA